jgi:hypothetical protein
MHLEPNLILNVVVGVAIYNAIVWVLFVVLRERKK